MKNYLVIIRSSGYGKVFCIDDALKAVQKASAGTWRRLFTNYIVVTPEDRVEYVMIKSNYQNAGEVQDEIKSIIREEENKGLIFHKNILEAVVFLIIEVNQNYSGWLSKNDWNLLSDSFG